MPFRFEGVQHLLSQEDVDFRIDANKKNNVAINDNISSPTVAAAVVNVKDRV